MQFVLLASLWWLEQHRDPPTQTQLADQAGTDPMMTSQVTRKLEARRLLERRPDPADARARRLRLTASGSALLASALADVEAADDACFSALGEDRGAFLAGLAALTDGGEPGKLAHGA